MDRNTAVDLTEMLVKTSRQLAVRLRRYQRKFAGTGLLGDQGVDTDHVRNVGGR